MFENSRNLVEREELRVDAGGGLSAADLQQIVMLSGLGAVPVSGRLQTVFRVVEFAGRPFKVRAFRDAAAAHRQLRLISKFETLFPRCYGRIGHCLIWEF